MDAALNVRPLEAVAPLTPRKNPFVDAEGLEAKARELHEASEAWFVAHAAAITELYEAGHAAGRYYWRAWQRVRRQAPLFGAPRRAPLRKAPPPPE